MRIWTTQSEEIINILIRDKIYRPDFSLSHGLGSEQMKGAYEGILKEYKEKNNIECKGLVFGISHLEDKEVESIEQYRVYFENNKLCSRKMQYDKFRRLHNQFEEVFIFIETVQAILQDI